MRAAVSNWRQSRKNPYFKKHYKDLAKRWAGLAIDLGLGAKIR
jgi:hypothetical protein